MSQTEVQLIKDAVIVNADVSNSAAIDVSKISGALPAAGGTITGDVTFDGETAGRDIVFDRSANALEFADNAKAVFGTGDDLQIYHDGSNGNSYIKEVTANVPLRILSSDLQIRSADDSEMMGRFLSDGQAELYHNNSKKFETSSAGVSVTGDLVVGTFRANSVSGNVFMADNDQLRLGAGEDLRLYHDGSNSYILSNTGDLIFQHGSENLMQLKDDGAVELYFDNAKKFETLTGGAKVTGTLDVSNALNVTGLTSLSDSLLIPDNIQAKFGAGSDLRIYHDGNDSYIDDAGTGSLLLRTTTNSNVSIKSSSAFMARFQTGDSVELYHNGNKKLETTSSGVNVTGALTVDGAAIGGGGKVLQVLQTTSNNASTSSGSFQDAGLSQAITMTNSANKILVIATGVMNNSSAGSGGGVSIFRGSTNLAHSNDVMGSYFGEDNSNNIDITTTIHKLDTPGSGTHTYAVKLRAFSGTQKFGYRNTGVLTVIELDFS